MSRFKSAGSVTRPLARKAAAVAVAIAVTTPAAFAQQDVQQEERAEVSFKLGRGHSDNIFQRGAGELSANYTSLGTVLDVYQTSRRAEFQIVGDVEYRAYSRSNIEDEPFGAIDLQANFDLVPEKFSWVVADSYGEGRLDPFQPRGPANREQINMLATGPQLNLPVNARSEVRISSMAGRRSYEETSAFDGDSLESTIGFYRQMNTTTELGVGFSTRDVEYDDITFDNTLERAFVAYAKQFATGRASIAVGSNKMTIGSRTESMPYIDVAWNRGVGARSTLSIVLQNELVDASDSFRGGQTFDDTLRSVDLYERTSASATFTVQGTRSQLGFSARIGDDAYETETVFDNETFQLGVNYQRAISGSMDFGAEVFLVERDFSNTGQEDEDLMLEVWAQKAFSRKLSLAVQYRMNDRGGNSGFTYDENTLNLTVQYRLNSRGANNLTQ